MIEKSNIRLRALELADIDLLYEWENNQALFQFGNPTVPFSRFQLKKFIESCSGDLYTDLQIRLVIEAFSGASFQPVGLIDAFEFDPYHLRAGIGIMIHERYQKLGYAGQALELFVEYLFEQWGLHQVTGVVAIANESSASLFLKTGFELIGVKKEWLKTASGFADVAEYQRINRK